MPRESAGILLYRISHSGIEVFLVHPGGPFWRKKDDGSWSVPKGELGENEDPLKAAQREFSEETGIRVSGEFIPLEPVVQKGGKKVHCFACMGDVDTGNVRSNTFEMEWPPRSGKKVSFPEIDRYGWFPVETARLKINQAQVSFITELQSIIEP